MKILFTNFTEIMSPGGVHKTILELSRYLSQIGHEVVVFQSNPLNLRGEEVIEGFRIIRVKSRMGEYLYGFSPKAWLKLNILLKEFMPDIVHVHGYHTLFSLGVVYLLKKYYSEVPVVFSPHFGVNSHSTFFGKIFWKPYNRLIGVWLVDNVDLIILASKFEMETFQREFPRVSDDKLVVVPHGVDKIRSKTLKKRNKKDRITLLYGGYLLESKGVQYTILTLDVLINKWGIQNVRLKIIGSGPYERKLRRLATDLGLSDFVEFIPAMPHSKFIEELEQADVFLYLSKAENYGITVAEALALGTPVIVAKETALIEFLREPGCFGVRYPPDPKKVAELVLKIVNNNIKVGPFSGKIRTWDKVAKDYENIYFQVGESRGKM